MENKETYCKKCNKFFVTTMDEKGEYCTSCITHKLKTKPRK